MIQTTKLKVYITPTEFVEIKSNSWDRYDLNTGALEIFLGTERVAYFPPNRWLYVIKNDVMVQNA